MEHLEPAIERAVWFSHRIRQRTDERLRKTIEAYDQHPQFHPIENLMISVGAWEHIRILAISPQLVFAHPDLIVAHPATSAYYRNMALLPQKRVAELATNVKAWEDGTRRSPVSQRAAIEVSKVYNAVLSSIIEGSTGWTIENGYRNIVASMG